MQEVLEHLRWMLQKDALGQVPLFSHESLGNQTPVHTLVSCSSRIYPCRDDHWITSGGLAAEASIKKIVDLIQG